MLFQEPAMVRCNCCLLYTSIKESHTKEIAENIPNAKLSIIKGNHFIANKQHATFNNAVEEFLQTIF